MILRVFFCLLAVCTSPVETCLLRSFPHFPVAYISLYYWIIRVPCCVCFPPAPAPLPGQDPRQPCVPAAHQAAHSPCVLCFLKLFGTVLTRALQIKGGQTNKQKKFKKKSSLHIQDASFFFFSFIFISWRLITLQYFSGFCHTLTWISHGVTCIPHPDPPSHLPLYPIPLGLPSAPGPSTCLSIQPGLVICFTIDNIYAVLLKHPTLAFSHRVQKSVLYICVSFSVLHIGLSLPSF